MCSGGPPAAVVRCLTFRLGDESPNIHDMSTSHENRANDIGDSPHGTIQEAEPCARQHPGSQFITDSGFHLAKRPD
jgi:hypothetical protein